MNTCNYTKRCKKFNSNTCEENSFCIRRFKIDKLLDLALLSEKQKHEPILYLTDLNTQDYETYTSLNDIYQNILEYVNKGENFYLYSGTPGNGKTSWALKLLISYVSRIWSISDLSCKALFINVPRFLLSLKSFISDKSDTYIPHIKNNVLTADLVIWDDIATKTMTEFETENLLSIINTRIDNGKSNIFTSNISPSYLSEYIGERLASRVLQSTQFSFFGKDMRGVQIDSTISN